MKYTFEFDPAARRELRTIDLTDARRILLAITALGDDPYAPDLDVKKLSGDDGLYRLRVGRFRVVYRIDNGRLVILVVAVGRRRDIYRGL
ncbi:type II toxin-antitoxin system RelE family toxin [Nocardia mexicana]|uniref:mRNA interferase RelE/StbE n=1 Tax=Nocardia mexicana TaxID=279262 RepID=A0A370H9T7_9NOCA|nr:type II toxin-antitoxin system RelE/ParE family toxin [Nocardia mexicana]RDI52784.1 mRNA interferase RelE/StbE [Nocardia mexicana]